MVPIQVQNDVSSTKVRDLVQKNRSIKYLVPDKTIAHIAQNGLYKK